MSSRDRLISSLSFFGFAVSGREVEEASEGGRDNSLKNPGAGKKTASVFDALVALPTCISRPNLANYRQMTAEPSSIYFLEGKAKTLTSTYNIQNMSKRVPSEKVRLLWLMMLPFERGELSCRQSCRGVRPFMVHSPLRVSANPIIMNRKRTGAMLSPCLTPT